MPPSPLISAPQAVSSLTFSPPSLDRALTIPELCDYHLNHNGDHPFCVYDTSTQDHDPDVVTITWRRASQATHVAAELVSAEVRQSGVLVEVPVIGILAVIDSLTYLALIIGVMRAGYRVFPISTRNSDIGVADLLRATDVSHLFISKDQAMQTLATSAVEKCDKKGIKIIDTIPTFEALYTVDNTSFRRFRPLATKGSIADIQVDDIAIILHSSGSTSFPKPIFLSHRNIFQWGTLPYYGETDLCGHVLACHSFPSFHAIAMLPLSWAITTGLTLAYFAPSHPPIIPTSDRVLNGAIATKCNLTLSVPSFLEEWSRDQKKIKALSQFRAVLFGGAPLSKETGDNLSKQGVPLFSLYGSTEVGAVSKLLPTHPVKEGWEYFELSSHVNPILLDHDTKEGIYHVIYEACSTHSPAAVNTGILEQRAYDTSDLFMRHPTNHKLWKVYGRADDQIIHSTGEKTNPIPMENIIKRHPSVNSCLIGGTGRFQVYLIVQPVEAYIFDPSDHNRLAAFRNLIWTSIEEANEFGPAHSRIFKELVHVTTPSKPFQFTPKGTPRRQAILDAYKEEIEAGYAALEESSQPGLQIPIQFDLHSTTDFVQRIIDNIMTVKNMKVNDDIFQHGCDSLQATWIRNTILHSLRRRDVLTRDIPINFVYLNPTVASLGAYITRVSKSSKGLDTDIDVLTHVAKIKALVEKYSKDLPSHKPQATETQSDRLDVILLTGSTGALGSYILESLVADSTVIHIYALNRRDIHGRSVRQRHSDAFQDRDIDLTILDSPKVTFVEGDTSAHMLGIPGPMYEAMRREVTHIIHNAWRVDFNVSIDSMEPLIAGTRYLVNFALSSPHLVPPRLLFVSSIGVSRNWSQGFSPEVLHSDPAVAVGSGYPESKWAAEQILALVAEKTALQPIIVQVGQLSGGRNGCWTSAEWIPSMIHSAQVLKCLPNTLGSASWLPVHIAASALIEMRNSRLILLHLVHPNPTAWSQIFGYFSEILDVPLEPYPAWLAALEASALQEDDQTIVTPSANPALRLLDFYRSLNEATECDAEALGFPQLSAQSFLEGCRTFKILLPLERGDVESWIGYWKVGKDSVA